MNKLSEELNREAIAKIIDPWGWDPSVARAWGEDTCEIHAKAALEKADAIIAMIARSEALSSPGGQGNTEAQGSGTTCAPPFANQAHQLPAASAVSPPPTLTDEQLEDLARYGGGPIGALGDDYCAQCGGPCLRRPRHGEGWG